MTPSLSPRSVLGFFDEIDTNVPQDKFSEQDENRQRRGEKRKLPLILNDDDEPDCQHRSPGDVFRSINLRHRLLCDRTVEWLATHSNTCHNLEELWLGPVFQSPNTLLLAIRQIPPSVKHLDLDLRNFLDLLPQALSHLFHPSKSHIQSISIRFFGDSGAIELAKWISRHPNLKRLDLRGNRIGKEGLAAIVRALGQYPIKLEYLNLSCNCIKDMSLLNELLASKDCSLETLDLSFNWIGDEDIGKLCSSLRHNTSLKDLNVFGCQQVSKLGMEQLVHCLEEYNTRLQMVHIQLLDPEMNKMHKTMNSWLSLNRAGRRLLREAPVTPGLWSRVLERSRHDPSALFFLLQQGVTPVLQDKR